VKKVRVINYPADTPFVFDNRIVLQGKLSKDETKNFTNNLPNYWDDSLQALKVKTIGFFYFNKLKNPPVFDTVNISRSIKFMSAYLKSQGYWYSKLSDSIHVDTIKGKKLVTVIMNVAPGKPTIIDSISYDLKDPRLQHFAQNRTKGSLIKPGKTLFAKDLIGAELDRLVNVYRNNGYFLFTRDNLIAEADTADVSLLQFTTDPFLQAAKIAADIDKRKQNPTCTIIIKQRPNIDSLKAYDSVKTTRLYHTGTIYYFPETGIAQIPDTVMNDTAQFKPFRLIDSLHHITMFSKNDKFVFQPMREHTYLFYGKPYNEFQYYKTINNLSQIGSWQQVDSRSVIRNDSVDFNIFLVPAVKQNITNDFEVSRNSGDFLSSNNLFGLTLNTSYRNRNVWKRAIQSVTTLSNGVELSFEPDLPLLQTVQSSLSHTYTFPHFLPPFKNWDKSNKWDNKKTFFSLNASYTDRSDFFRLRSFVANTGIQWKKKNQVWQFTPINIELYSLDTLPLLDSAFTTNPYLRTAFNTGSVVSSQATFSIAYVDKNHQNRSNYFNAGIEWTLLGTIIANIGKSQNDLYQFAKIQGQYVRTWNYKHSQLAMRSVLGFGYNYGNSSRFGNTLPFFKQFVEGGPNSMRGWGLRQLGLGSSLLSDTASSSFRDRYGDMQLEANIEYRFPLATIGGVNINSAVFTDVGNIWNVINDPNNPNGTFRFNTLGKDIAIAVGTGLRFDFSYFLIRIDFGLKLKDPARLENNGWLNVSNFTWRNDEFNVKDAVTGQPIPQNNYAFQLGIGLPF
jgi:hypothetical protein